MFAAPGASSANTADSGPHTFSSSREELLHGARQPEVRGKGGVRSAAEIRSAYSRSSTRYSQPSPGTAACVCPDMCCALSPVDG